MNYLYVHNMMSAVNTVNIDQVKIVDVMISPFQAAAYQSLDEDEDHQIEHNDISIEKIKMLEYFIFNAHLPPLNTSRSCELKRHKNKFEDIHIDGVGTVSKHLVKTVRFSDNGCFDTRSWKKVKRSCLKNAKY